MCLSRLKEFRTIGDEGYKVFRIRGGKLTTLCAGKRDKPFLRGRWLKAKDWHEESRSPWIEVGEIEGDIYPTYRAGWHIFMAKQGTVGWCDKETDKIFKVKYRNVAAKGKQCKDNIIVAREMLILGEV